ncbi:MAG: M48 family metallopeptidase, partial [Victivallales bacterium]|nr:M48 family metallopeptidase [Victivallales bacterium]
MKRLAEIFILFALIINIVFLCGCSSVPYTERSRFLMTGEQTENNLGRDAWKKMLTEGKISNNPKQNQALLRIGRNISAVAGKPGYKWEFRVFDNPQANAFCLPGGKVGVTNSLFAFTANDAELATVVGHEIGHAIARHGGERMTHGILQEVGSQAVSYGTQEPMFVSAFGLLSNVGAVLPYSRVHEYEADHIGLILMAKAGYYPRAALSFWKKFGKGGSNQRVMELLSTHPMSKKRLEEMEALQKKAREYYNKAPQK